jgi:hypothetical protein
LEPIYLQQAHLPSVVTLHFHLVNEKFSLFISLPILSWIYFMHLDFSSCMNHGLMYVNIYGVLLQDTLTIFQLLNPQPSIKGVFLTLVTNNHQQRINIIFY